MELVGDGVKIKVGGCRASKGPLALIQGPPTLLLEGKAGLVPVLPPPLFPGVFSGGLFPTEPEGMAGVMGTTGLPWESAGWPGP